MHKAIPCHLIAGALGIGKTTAIRRFVARSAAFTGVIVNDFGKTGYDAALIAAGGGTDRLRVEHIPGGCLCCTSAAQMLPALEILCARPEVEQIIIEPGGIVLIDPLLEMLYAAAPRCRIEVMPVIVLFDPAKNRPERLAMIPYWNRLAECADIAVANRCDLAAPEQVETFMHCLKNWTPPKLSVICTSHDELPPEIFKLRKDTGCPVRTGHHYHAELPPSGIFSSGDTFYLPALIKLLETLAPQLDRFKGSVKTEQGWQRVEIAFGGVFYYPAPVAECTAVEWIGDVSGVAQQINACRLTR
ncbi:MAG: GTP-binding protein [Kiritimatiellales bacterium]